MSELKLLPVDGVDGVAIFMTHVLIPHDVYINYTPKQVYSVMKHIYRRQ